MAKALPYTVEEQARNVHTITMEARAGWEQYFLLRTDAHRDNAHCRGDLEKKHLDMAKERNAGIIEGGDTFCAMQGKWDKRADPGALIEELRGANYLNNLSDYVAAKYAPYKDNFAVISPGNHETAILKHHGYNLTQELAKSLGCHFASYAHWVRFQFRIYQTQKESINLYCHHGYGGGGAVTKGVIQSNRMAVYLPDAHIVMTGHTHDHWLLPLGRARISQSGVPFQDEQNHVRCGGYKDEFAGGNGWHTERGGEPKPLGAVWLRFYFEKPRIRYELSRAT